MQGGDRTRRESVVVLQVWDLVVVGAGIAGSALAFSQGKVGQLSVEQLSGSNTEGRPAQTSVCCLQESRRVLLLERDLSQPDRIVGELLQPGGFLKLKSLGLASCVEGIDSQKV